MNPPDGKSENKESSRNARNEETDLTERGALKTNDGHRNELFRVIVSWVCAFVKREWARAREKSSKGLFSRDPKGSVLVSRFPSGCG
jgi:hypothetical protein